MKDRLVAGGLAGLIGALAQNLYGTLAKAVGITDRAFKDFAEVLVTFKDYSGIMASVVGFIAHMAVGVMFGIVFAYILMKTAHRYYLIKGVGYGVILWFLLLGFGTIYKLPKFMDIPPNAALSTLVGAIIYGLVTAYVLKLLDEKTRLI